MAASGRSGTSQEIFAFTFAKTGRINHARGSNDQSFFGRLPPPADRCAAGLVYAAGWPPAGGAAQAKRFSRLLLPRQDGSTMRVAPMTSRFLDACRRRPTDVRPVWFMRQAGRYMKQYRQIRDRHGILEICKRHDLASFATLQPVEMLDVDAAIIFADLLLPVEP